MQLDGLSLVIAEKNLFLDGADTEDAMGVDDILAAQTQHVMRDVWHLFDDVFDLRKSEGDDEMSAVGIIDIGVVVVGLKIKQKTQVYSVEFIVCAQTQGAVHSLSLL